MRISDWSADVCSADLSRPFVFDLKDGKATAGRAIDGGLIGDTPSKPFGGGEELAWGADSRTVYFALRKADRDEPRSTNLDLRAEGRRVGYEVGSPCKSRWSQYT